MRKNFNQYLNRVDDLTVSQRETLLERLTKQASQEIVHYEIEKRIENVQECPHC